MYGHRSRHELLGHHMTFLPPQVVIGLIAIFAYNWRLTLVVLSLIPVIAVCMFLQVPIAL